VGSDILGFCCPGPVECCCEYPPRSFRISEDPFNRGRAFSSSRLVQRVAATSRPSARADLSFERLARVARVGDTRWRSAGSAWIGRRWPLNPSPELRSRTTKRPVGSIPTQVLIRNFGCESPVPIWNMRTHYTGETCHGERRKVPSVCGGLPPPR